MGCTTSNQKQPAALTETSFPTEFEISDDNKTSNQKQSTPSTETSFSTEFEISNDTKKNIYEFVTRIAQDLGTNEVLAKQRSQFNCGEFLVNPLPLDSASTSNRAEVVTQLIHTVGTNPLKAAYESMNTTECQSVNVLCSVAASGMGKTHMVYTLGLSGVYSILIRVGLQTGGLTLPWSTLVRKIEEEKQFTQRSNLDMASVSMNYIRLLIFCYMDATLQVISNVLSSHHKISQDNLPEILLRFHRNGKAEKIIDSLFSEKIVAIFTPVMSCEDRRCKINAYRDFISNKISKLNLSCPFLLCFDEIQVLINQCNNCFYSTNDYLALRNGDGDDDQAQKRDLFYATFYVMTEILNMEKWTIYMTGTYFSLNLANASPSGFSPARGGKISKVFPEGYITVPQMKTILQHYWNISDGVFADPIVNNWLQKFSGRPVIFADGVFKIMCDSIMFAQSADPLTSLSASSMVVLLEKGYKKMMQHFCTMVERLLKSNKGIPNEECNSTIALIPALIDHFLFGYNLNLSRVKDQAIASGLLGFQEMEDGTFNIQEEPLVRSAIESTLCKKLMEQYNETVDIIAHATRIYYDSKGDFVEYLIALDLCLRCRLEQFQNKKPLTVGSYFAQFGIQYPNLDVWNISSKIRPIAHSDDKKTFFRSFLDNSAVDTVYYKIAQHCGCDLALKVTHCTEGKSCLVVIQVKNESRTSLQDLSITLHPATQYLNNYPREMLIHGISPWRVTQMTSSIIHLQDHLSFFTDTSTSYELTSNWIRIGLIAGMVDNSSKQLSKELCDADDIFLLGSLNCEFWLTSGIRRKYVTSGSSLNCDATISMLRMKSVDTLMQMQPNFFKFDLVPRVLEAQVKTYRNGGTLSEEDVMQYVPDATKARRLLQLLESERSNREKYADIVKSRNI